MKCKYDDWEWYDYAMGMLCLQGYNHCRGEKCPKFESIKDKQVPVKCKVKVKKK